LVVALMFVTSGGLTIGESGVTALFLDRFGAHALPVMYLAQGVTGLAAMLVLTGALARADRRRAYVAMPLLLAFLVIIERVILAAHPGWIYPVLWLTVTLDWLLQAVFLWGAAGLVTDTRRAKRLFPLFAAGGILGSVIGGLATRVLADTIGAGNLLVVWFVSLVGAAALCAMVLGVRPLRTSSRPRMHRRRPPAYRDITQGLGYVLRSPLLVWMTIAGVLFSLLFYSLYLPFAQAATQRFADPEALAGFLGLFWAGVTGAAFLVSMLLANRLLGWLGAALLILLLPILYAGSFGWLLVSSSLATLAATRFGVNVWLQGVGSPSWETLVNVIPEANRDQVRAFLNGGPTQVGTAIAGVVTLLGQQILSARQLTFIGLVVSAVTIVAALRIRRAYAGALADALRAGRPRVFERTAVEGTPVLIDRDAQAIGLAIDSSDDPDPRIRRLAVEMLMDPSADPRVPAALARRASDEDAMVRALAIRGLGRIEPTELPALERALDDEDEIVRVAAVEALGASPDPAAASRLERFILADDPSLAGAACLALLGEPSRQRAFDRLRSLLSDSDPEVRLATLRRLALADAPDVVALVHPLLVEAEPSILRAQALRTLAAAAPDEAIQPALDALGTDEATRAAALDVLGELDLRDYASALGDRAAAHSSLATRDHELAASIPPDGEASKLLRAALLDRGRSHAVAALSAVALMSADRGALRTALENLQGPDQAQLANALESFETSEYRSLVRPLLRLWEETGPPPSPDGDWLAIVSNDADPLIRECVALLRETNERGEAMSRSRTSISPIERVLVLRTIPLFAGLSPSDLRSVADIAEERSFGGGDVIAVEGEAGDELHIVLAGTVAVVRGEGGTIPVARRGQGEVVGEMSIITHAPRVASLVAEGDVRTLRIGSREFETMIRERPDVSLAVMRELAERLGAATTDR
jgi:CRP/FNR family cyclic AMP-dependent transcriptional regulator